MELMPGCATFVEGYTGKEYDFNRNFRLCAGHGNKDNPQFPALTGAESAGDS
jgi:hypothetical protein